MKNPHFVKETGKVAVFVKETDKVIEYRDEQIKTTWKVSKFSNRIYRKPDVAYATADMQLEEGLSLDVKINKMHAKATFYHNRIMKAGGWTITGCSAQTKYDLNGNRVSHKVSPLSNGHVYSK